MRERIIGENVKKVMLGVEILAIIPTDDYVGIALDNDLSFYLFHNSFWRVLDKDNVIASSKDLFARCGYDDVSWIDHFPPAVQEKVDDMEEYDEEVASEYLEKHIDKLISAVKDSLEGKTIKDVTICPCGDIDISVSDGVRIQAYTSFPGFAGEEAYRLEKG